MKTYTNWVFWDLFYKYNPSLYGDFTIVNLSFSMYLFYLTGEHYPQIVKILPFFLNYNYLVPGLKEMAIFEISGLFMYHCVSVCSAHKLLLK